MRYDRDRPIILESETHTYQLASDGSQIPLYSVGIRMTDYVGMCSGYQINYNKIDPRCLEAAYWLRDRGLLDEVYASQGQHIVIYMEQADFLLFKLTFAGLL